MTAILAAPAFGNPRPISAARNLSFATVAPPEDRRAPVWDRPVPHPGADKQPLVWLLGAHGGAGVSTLEQLLAPAADCHRRWPGGLDDESPYVIVVARETLDGLTRAHELLRQYHCDLTGPAAHLVGLITCAHHPGRTQKPIRNFLGIISELVPESGRWRIGWQEHWPLTHIADLPSWSPGDSPPERGGDPLEVVRPIGDALIEIISAIESPTRKEEKK